MLHGDGTSREAARALLHREAGRHWQLVPDPAHRQRIFVVGMKQEWSPHGSHGTEPVASRGLFEGVNRAAPAAQEPHGSAPGQTIGAEGLTETPKPCGGLRDYPDGGNGAVSAADAPPAEREPGEDDVDPEALV
jgi:hypothetical protein